LNKSETERIVRNKGKSQTSNEEKMAIIASSVARRLLLLPAMVLGAALVIGKRKLEVGEDLKAKGLVKSWGHLRFYL
jgi:hypothetical protein